MNFHILAKKNLGPGVAYNKFTTVRAADIFGRIVRLMILEIYVFALMRENNRLIKIFRPMQG